DYDGKHNRAPNQPPRPKPYLLGWETLWEQVNVGAEIYAAPNDPTQFNSCQPAQRAHHSRFSEEELLDISVASAQRLHDSNFPSPLQDCHYQRIDNPNRCHSQRQAAKYA